MPTAWRSWTKLSPKTADLSGMPAGGEPLLPPHIVAAACAGLPRRHNLAGRVRYLRDWSVGDELAVLLWFTACDLARRERWKLPPGKEYLRRLARCAVVELGDPRPFLRVSLRYETTQIPKASWYRTWQARYQQVYSEVHRWSDIAALHMHRQLRDEETSAS